MGDGADGRDGRNKSQNNHFILERSAAITDSAVNEASEREGGRPTDGRGRSSLCSSARRVKGGREAAMTGQACGGGRTRTLNGDCS